MSDSLRRTVHKGTTKIERHHKLAKPYPTSKLKRFGDYSTKLMPEAMPITTTLPV